MAGQGWTEVSNALQNKRRELVLNGSDVAERIKVNGIDERIFALISLNFLEISNAGMTEVPNEIGCLTQLLHLILRCNRLASLPDAIGNLTQLQLLDVSGNALERVPQHLGDQLESLHTLDLSLNSLTDIPESLGRFKNLAKLNLSGNNLSNLDFIFDGDLTHVSEILAAHNQIDSISSAVGSLEALRTLDLGKNKLQDLPASLAQCPKLKELSLGENPVKDRRLWKLIQQSRGTKAILQYIGTHGTKTEPTDASKPAKEKKGKRKKKASQSNDEELIKQIVEVLHVRDVSQPLEVRACKSAIFVRPYIVCCIVRNVDLASGNRFKQFLTAQTKLHESPLCRKRTIATIATHDRNLIKGPLVYEGKAPENIELTPLGKWRSTTAKALMARLNQEADELRKELKRNAVSGIHQYLGLLAGQDLYPCVTDSAGHVISFPPITNADFSKISKSTTDVLIEVTGSEDLASCKTVLEALLAKMLELDLGSAGGGGAPESAGAEASPDGAGRDRKLTVEQVRVLNEEGELRVVYPSKTDLNVDGITVIR